MRHEKGNVKSQSCFRTNLDVSPLYAGRVLWSEFVTETVKIPSKSVLCFENTLENKRSAVKENVSNVSLNMHADVFSLRQLAQKNPDEI